MIKNGKQNDDESDLELIDEQDYNVSSAHRRMQKNRMERQVRQTQMWLGRLRIFSRLMTIVLLILFGYFLVRSHQWYLKNDIFSSPNNSSLEILNNKIVPSYKILAALRRTDLPNVPIYRMETDGIKHNIMQIEPIEDVFIRRFWFPARLQIIVQERVPILTISPDLKVAPIAFFARGGKLIGRDYMPLNKSFKTYLVLASSIKGDNYRTWDNDKVKLIERVAKAVEVSSNEKVEYIDVRLPKDVYVKIKTVNIRLGKLDETVFSRIERITSILPQVKMLDKKIKYLDLRWKDANYIKLG